MVYAAIRPILARYGVQTVEFHILDWVRLMCGYIARNKLVALAHNLGTDDNFSLDDLEATVEKCLEKGWIKVLTAAEEKPPYTYAGCSNSWRVPDKMRIFGASKEAVKETIEEIRTGKDSLYLDDGLQMQITDISEPVEIGSWWLNRFVHLSSGYLADVSYRMEKIEGASNADATEKPD